MTYPDHEICGPVICGDLGEKVQVASIRLLSAPGLVVVGIGGAGGEAWTKVREGCFGGKPRAFGGFPSDARNRAVR
jgi:hypothetical protein